MASSSQFLLSVVSVGALEKLQERSTEMEGVEKTI